MSADGLGAPIPHVPGKPFPYAGCELVSVQVRGLFAGSSYWSAPVPAYDLMWGDLSGLTIVRYRMRADHHAYGARRSRFPEVADEFCNHYPFEEHETYLYRKDTRYDADDDATDQRLGIWHIHWKEEANG